MRMRLHDMSPPTYLNFETVPIVEHCMTTAEFGLNSALCTIQPNITTDRLRVHIGNQYQDTSFKRQMLEVSGIAPTDETDNYQPDVFLVTANSAIPIADSIRGFYEVLGIEPPLVGYININRHFNPDNEADTTTRDEEAKRLIEVLDGAERVCVVEEYVDLGRSLKNAEEILRMAGAVTITAVRGRWYRQWDRLGSTSGLDFDSVSSSLREDMLAIGRKSAEY